MVLWIPPNACDTYSGITVTWRWVTLWALRRPYCSTGNLGIELFTSVSRRREWLLFQRTLATSWEKLGISVEGCSVRGLTPLPLVHAGYAAPRYFPSPWILHGLHPPQLFLSDYWWLDHKLWLPRTTKPPARWRCSRLCQTQIMRLIDPHAITWPYGRARWLVHVLSHDVVYPPCLCSLCMIPYINQFVCFLCLNTVDSGLACNSLWSCALLLARPKTESLAPVVKSCVARDSRSPAVRPIVVLLLS